MNDNSPDTILLEECARNAWGIAMQYFQSYPQVWQKDQNAGPVTEADLAVNTYLSESLCMARPDYAWLSEESEDGPQRLNNDWLFIIDPIDGTQGFIEGGKGWGHSLAVAYRGVVQSAAVYLPVVDHMFTASRGGGAYLNGQAINISDAKQADGASVLAVKSNLSTTHWPHGAPNFKRYFVSSLANRLCAVAKGRYDAMFTFRPTWEWDIAAGALIIEEAGGTITDQRGQGLRFNSEAAQCDGVIAANRAVHADILDIRGFGTALSKP